MAMMRHTRQLDHTHPVLHDGSMSLRPSTTDDIDLLSGWFVQPDVRWWGGVAAVTRQRICLNNCRTGFRR
jgi:hypothetical protein